MTVPAPGPRPASGEQFKLRRGAARAQIGQVAAVLREFSVDGVHYTETWDDAGASADGVRDLAGAVAEPGGRRALDPRRRKAQQLDITDLEYGHAIHGLLRNTAYQPVQVDDAAVTLAASIYPQHGYPFLLDVADHLRARRRRACRSRISCAMSAPRPAPFGVGAHPYLRVGDHPVEDLRDHRDRHAVRPDRRADDPGGRRAGRRHADGPARRVLAWATSTSTWHSPVSTSSDGRVEHRLRAPDGNGVCSGRTRRSAGHRFSRRRSSRSGKAEPAQGRRHRADDLRGERVQHRRRPDHARPGEQWSASWGIRPLHAGSRLTSARRRRSAEPARHPAA